MSDKNITVGEKHMSVTGRPMELKYIAEALYAYAESKGMDLPKTLGDLAYAMNAEYQCFHGLDEHDWDWTPEEKEELGLGEFD